MIRLIFYWTAILFLQFVVFNHLGFTAYLAPQVFIVLLITLPLHISKPYQVLLGFILGLIADFFVGTPGIHASACMWLVMIRLLWAARSARFERANCKSFALIMSIRSGFQHLLSTTAILVAYLSFLCVLARKYRCYKLVIYLAHYFS